MSVPNEEVCPVPLEILSRLMGAKGSAAADIILGLPAATRSRLALFCYRRAHLRSLGLTIATHCSRDELCHIGLIAGDALYIAAREAAQSEGLARPKISLAKPRVAAAA